MHTSTKTNARPARHTMWFQDGVPFNSTNASQHQHK